MRDKRYTALVIDDDANVRALANRALSAEGFSVDEAADGLDAERLLAYQTYDVVATDLRMPRRHGHALLAKLLELTERPVLVAMTGVDNARIAADLILKGIDEVVTKPLNYQVFAGTVRARVQRKRDQTGTPLGPAPPLQEAGLRERIAETSNRLREHLAEISEAFGETIASLKRQRDELESGYLDFVRMLTNLLSEPDGLGNSHLTRVEAIASAIGASLKLDDAELRDLRIGALLHDIGLLSMPDSIRTAPPGTLEGSDLETFRKYPLIGATLLSEVAGTERIVEAVVSHAENFDGTGFPAQKRGTDIPLAARILRVADGCDTFLTYTASDDQPAELAEHVRSMSGRAYDPSLATLALLHTASVRSVESARAAVSIDASEIRAGRVLAENLYDKDGRFLAKSGTTISEVMARNLSQLLRRQTVRVYTDDAS